MTTRRMIAAVVLAAVLGPGAACRKKKAVERLTEERFVLANGLRVELVTGPCGDGAEVVALFDVGTDHDPAGKSGLVDVLARVVPMEAAADHAVIERRVATGEVAAAIDGVAATMTRVEHTADAVARARGAALATLARMRGGDARLTATSYAAEAIRPTPGRGWRGGVAAEIEAIDAGALAGFWHQHGKAGQARLVIVGRVDAAAIRTRVEEAFATVPAGTAAVRRPPTETTVTGTLVMGDAPAAIAIAIPAPAPTEPVYPAFLILATRLGGFEPVQHGATVLVVDAIAAGESVEAATARVRGVVATTIARPLTKDDVAAAQRAWAAPLDLASCRRDPRAFAIAIARADQLGVDVVALARAIAATTPAQLDAAAAWFGPERTAAAIAGGTVR